MPLYVIRPPDPPAGEDWVASVPGQYIYNITGIYATLATHDIGPAPQQLFYTAAHVTPNSILEAWVQPVSATENQMQLASEVGAPGLSVPFPSLADGVAHMLAWVWDGAAAHYYVDGVPLGVAQPTTPSAAPIAMAVTELGAAGPASTVIDELSAHRSALSGANIAALFAAASVGFAAYSAAVLAAAPECYYHFDGPSPTSVCLDVSGNGNDGTYTAISGSPEFVPGLVAGNDALRWSAHAGVNETRVVPAPLGIDWTSPFTLILWSLQEPDPPSTGRQVTLSITDSNNEVERIPSGFAPLATPGPYAWSWLPKLNSASESPDAATITVPLPRLILPAGYTVGPKTLDITALDQWHDISVWWNSDIMDAAQDLNPYAYPPGATLVYRQVKGNQ